MTDGMMNLQEVLEFLRVSEHDIQSHIRKGNLDAYRIGGVYLRFRQEQVRTLKSRLEAKNKKEQVTVGRLRDFWQFNSFYIVIAVILGGILFFVLS